MVFSSSLFLVYFLPSFLLLYFITDKKYKNLIALLASAIFYLWGGRLFSFILFASIVIDFRLIKRSHNSTGEERIFLFWSSIVLNLVLLGYFKYANFFVSTLVDVSGFDPHWVKVILPIGISFFTFQKISYTIDVIKGDKEPLDSFTDYALYVLFFPRLIAGPIVRYHEIVSDLLDREKRDTIDDKIMGFFRFSIGLAKKVLIANTLAVTVDKIFLAPVDHLTLLDAWLGLLLFTFQIYFDFSGYSDMAIGLGRILGFKLPENFNFPYISQNITEFWKRWHITLGNWMKDYLYVPLGGNRATKNRLYINLSVVFLLSGLWHGSSWNFIIWGIFHGLFLILDRMFLIKLSEKYGNYFSIPFTFFIITISWVIFKIDNLNHLGSFLSVLFTGGLSKFPLVILDAKTITVFLLAIVISFSPLLNPVKVLLDRVSNWTNLSDKKALVIGCLTFFIVTICLSHVAASDFNPFIYFRF